MLPERESDSERRELPLLLRLLRGLMLRRLWLRRRLCSLLPWFMLCAGGREGRWRRGGSPQCTSGRPCAVPGLKCSDGSSLCCCRRRCWLSGPRWDTLRAGAGRAPPAEAAGCEAKLRRSNKRCSGSTTRPARPVWPSRSTCSPPGAGMACGEAWTDLRLRATSCGSVEVWRAVEGQGPRPRVLRMLGRRGPRLTVTWLRRTAPRPPALDSRFASLPLPLEPPLPLPPLPALLLLPTLLYARDPALEARGAACCAARPASRAREPFHSSSTVARVAAATIVSAHGRLESFRKTLSIPEGAAGAP